MFNISCLGSGSKGNCYVVSNGSSHFMIECGLPIKTIQEKLGKTNKSLNDIEFCLISHRHKDHSKSARDLAYRRVKIITEEDTAKLISGAIIVMQNGSRITVGDFTIIAFSVEHGSTNCLGYYITSGDDSLLFMTDFNNCKPDLSIFQPKQIMIECNYLERMIDFKDLKARRQINTHMGLKGTIEMLNHLNLDKCRQIFLIHLSNKYGNELIFQSLIQTKTGIETNVCHQNGKIT